MKYFCKKVFFETILVHTARIQCSHMELILYLYIYNFVLEINSSDGEESSLPSAIQNTGSNLLNGKLFIDL